MKLAGNIGDLGLGDILQIISFSQKSGTLQLTSRKREGTIVFENGLVTRTSSTKITDGIGETLVKNNVIDDATLQAAKQAQVAGGYAQNLGTILKTQFNVSEEQLTDASKKLIEITIYSFFFWLDGNFTFELLEFNETPELIKADTFQYSHADGLNPQFLAMEGSRLYDEFLRDGGTLEEEEPAAPAAEAAHAPPPAPEPTPSPEVVAEAVPEATPAPAAPEAFSPDSFAYAEQSAPPATQPGTAESKDAGLFNDSFLQELQGEGLLEAPSEPAADERVEESKGLMLLKEMQEELARPLTMSEIVLLLLRFTSEIMHRAIVFAIRKENIVGMGQYGIELKGANADIMIRKMKIPMSEPSIIKDAIDSKVQQLKPMESTPWNDYLIEKLGGVRPSQAFVTPVLVHDKVAVIIYGDTIPENGPIGDTSALEIFLAQASTALENIVDQKQSGLST